MIHYNYSRNQLEEKALALLKKYDPERLIKCKPIDVYEVIEMCLDVPYDWKYLTPDQSILGMTAFKSGSLWVWPKSYFEEGMLPSKILVEEGTILIDSTLTELSERGPENFTVMHEVFHQILHKTCFRHQNPDYTHCTTRNALKNTNHSPKSSLEICEYQANACAAAFLMPKPLLTEKVNHYAGGRLRFEDNFDYMLAKNLANEFSVSTTAMKYRLLNLGLADR